MRHLCSTGGRIGRALAILVAAMPAIGLAADSWSIQLGIRETGSTGAIGSNGGTSGTIEWITSTTTPSIISNGSGWQEFRWNFGTDPVTAFTGNGVLSAANNKGVLEHIRIVNSGGNSGGEIRLRIDDIVNTTNLNTTPVNTTITGFEGFSTSTPNDSLMFREPLNSTSTDEFMSTGPNSTLISTSTAHGGTQSLAARWTFVPDGSTTQWLRLSTNNATTLPNPVIDIGPNSSLSLWLNMQTYQPTGTRVRGLDASEFQGSGHDWARVAAPMSSGGAGMTFAILRATRGGTSGTSSTGSFKYDDPQYASNVAGSKNAGLLTGSYHFARWDTWTPLAGTAGLQDSPSTVGRPEDEARHMLATAGQRIKVGYLRPTMDFEDPNGASADPTWSDDELSNYVHRFNATMVKYRGPAAGIIVYAGTSYANRLNTTVQQYPLWMPRYQVETAWQTGDPFTTETSYGAWDVPGVQNPLPWDFYQYYSPDVYIPGISAGTHNDIDVAHGDINYVRQFLVQGAIWDGSASATWATGANWDTNAEPASNTEILFDGPVPGTGSSITLSSGRAASGIYFAESYTLTGGSLSLNDGRIDVDAAKSATIATSLSTPNGFRKVGTGSLTHTSGTSTVTGIAQVLQGTMNVSGGSIAVSGNLLVNPELTQFDKSLVAPLPTMASQITNSILTINGGSVSAATAFVGGSDTTSGAIGTLNVSSGSLSVTGAMKIWNSAVSLVNSKVNFSGGSMSLGSLNTDGDATSFNWTGGTLTIGGNNSTSTFSSTGSGTASLVKTGTDTLTLSGANTYTGGTTVNAGLLTVTGAAAKLGSGNVTVLDPGTGAGGGLSIQTGVLNAIGDNATLSLAGGSTPNVADVGLASLGAGVNDRIGALILGGIAQINGRTYGSSTSTAMVQSDEYFLGGGMITVGLLGDYNADFTVNGADYVVWRKFDGSAAGYDAWRQNFGNTAPGGGSALGDAAVPEPTSILLMLAGSGALCQIRGRRTRDR